MSDPITIIIDHKLRVPLQELSEEELAGIKEALTIPNLEKANAKKQHIWGWERMADSLRLYETDGIHLIMPRGFLSELISGFHFYGRECDVLDLTQKDIHEIGHNRISFLRPWQSDAFTTMVDCHNGIYKAPAGSGKTVTMLAVMASQRRKSLVIVNTKDILWQWIERAKTFLGDDYPVGKIGDNDFEVSDALTIATAQTLHSRFDNLEREGFFDEFGFVCLDECHHATADTYNKIMDRFSAKWRIGVSATPDKTGDFALAKLVLGPIIHETKPSEVTTLMKPEVIRVPTKFKYAFRPTKNRWNKSNYGPMVQSLITDPGRNNLIVDAIQSEAGHHSLMVTKRIEHIDIIEAMLVADNFPDPIVRLTGQDTPTHRKYVVEPASSEPCLVLSTLADEALDIPRLDRGFLVFPQRNAGLVTQQVGRFERMHPDKKDAKIYDFMDILVGPFEKQWRIRRFEVYEPRGYKITLRNSDGI